MGRLLVILVAALVAMSFGQGARAAVGDAQNSKRLSAVLASDNFTSLTTETDCSGQARYNMQGCPYPHTPAAHTVYREECYGDSLAPSPVTLHNGGGVTLTATARPGSGLCAGRSYRSAYLSTFKSFDTFQYGYIEVRAVMPSCGHGHWPALWLLPAGGRWTGEIDFGEVAWDGLTYAIHANQGRTTLSGHLKLTSACDGRSHAYGLLLAPDEPVRWYFDGREVAEAVAPAGLLGTKWFLIMNLGIASTNFSGKSDAQTTPTTMIVQSWVARGLRMPSSAREPIF